MDKGESTTKKKRKYVRVACVNCRRSKTGCDVSRPCKRCVQHGWESTCIDRPTKSTSSNDSTSEEVACLSPFTNPSPPLAYNTNTENPSPSTEKEYLLDVIARLQRKNYEQELQIQSYEVREHSDFHFPTSGSNVNREVYTAKQCSQNLHCADGTLFILTAN